MPHMYKHILDYYLTRAKASYSQHGIFAFYKHVLTALGFLHFDRSLVFLYLDLNTLSTTSLRHYTFTIATIDEVYNSNNYNDYWFQKAEALSRLRCGHRLFILKDNNKILYYLWTEQHCACITSFDLTFRLPNHICYITGIYTLPEFRNRGIAFRIKKEICHYLKQIGITHLIEVVDPINTKALSIDRHLGFREYQTITYSRFWIFRYFRINKHSSHEKRHFFTVFKTPEWIWKLFLPF